MTSRKGSYQAVPAVKIVSDFNEREREMTSKK